MSFQDFLKRKGKKAKLPSNAKAAGQLIANETGQAVSYSGFGGSGLAEPVQWSWGSSDPVPKTPFTLAPESNPKPRAKGPYTPLRVYFPPTLPDGSKPDGVVIQDHLGFPYQSYLEERGGHYSDGSDLEQAWKLVHVTGRVVILVGEDRSEITTLEP